MASLRAHVSSGVSWNIVGLAANRVSAIATQVALGFLLSPLEWGIYAGAISIASFAISMRDGGIVDVLASREPKGFSSIVRAAGGVALSINLVLASGIIVSSVLLSGRLGGRQVTTIGTLLAAALIISTPNALMTGLLRSQLRFRELALITGTSAVLRSAATVGFAASGFGAVSFVAGVPVIGLVEGLVLWRAVRPLSIASKANSEPTRVLRSSSVWLTAAAGGTALASYGDYFVLGLFLTPTILGVYYFAFQLVAQTATMVLASMNPVLIPTFSRLKGADRLQHAAAETVGALSLALGILSAGIAVTFPHLEQVVWDGRWAAASGAVQALCLGFTMRGTIPITRALLISHGQFRQSATQAWIFGAGLLVVAAFAGSNGYSPTGAAFVVSAYFTVASPVALMFALRLASINLRSPMKALLFPWLMTLLVGSIWIAIDRTLLPSLAASSRLGLLSLGYGASIVTAARLAMPSVFRQVLTVLPIPTSAVFKVLRL